MLSSVSFKTHL